MADVRTTTRTPSSSSRKRFEESAGADETRATPLRQRDGFILRRFYARQMAGQRVLLADDVRNTGKTLQQCAELVTGAGGRVIGTVEICDRMEAIVDLGVPNYALAEYPAPENYEASQCPMCREGMPITTF